jgi:hypothetical protein
MEDFCESKTGRKNDEKKTHYTKQTMFKRKQEQRNGTGSNIRRSTITACVGLLKNTQALQAQQDDGFAHVLVDAACR